MESGGAAMEWLNYHHLLYFHAVAKAGGLVPAAERLRLSPPTLSAQIHELEKSLGEKLFEKRGRRLELTELGRVCLRYADEIFSLGQEMLDALHDRPTGRPLRLAVGVEDVIPKLVVHRLLEPVRRMPERVQLVCTEDRGDRLLAALAVHDLDVVFGDAPAAQAPVRAFSHELGESGVGFFGVPEAARRHAAGWPRSLDGAPVVLPVRGTTLRRSLDGWFDLNGVRPEIVAELEDSALMATFGADGLGLFPAPLVVAQPLTHQYRVALAGKVQGVRERYYGITMDRRLRHPAVAAIREAARARLARQTTTAPARPRT